jgi:hypothetical protein
MNKPKKTNKTTRTHRTGYKPRYVASCMDCNWNGGLYAHKHEAQKDASAHASQYGHKTSVEEVDIPVIDNPVQ